MRRSGSEWNMFPYIGGKMKLKVLLVLFVLSVAAVVPGASVYAVDTCYVVHGGIADADSTNLKELDLGICDTLRIGCPVCITFSPTSKGDSFYVPVYLFNDYPVGGFNFGVRQNGQQLKFSKNFKKNNAILFGGSMQLKVSAAGDSLLFGWADFSGESPIPACTGDTGQYLGSIIIKMIDTVRQVVRLDSVSLYPPAGPFIETNIFPWTLPPVPGVSASNTVTKKSTPKFAMCKQFTPPCDIALPVEGNADLNLPTKYELSQNVPNPFNPSTTIQFAIPKSGNVKVEVFNMLGQKVRTLLDDYEKAGYKRVEWDGNDQNGSSVASGVYLYRMSSGDFTETKKMLLLK